MIDPSASRPVFLLIYEPGLCGCVGRMRREDEDLPLRAVLLIVSRETSRLAFILGFT